MLSDHEPRILTFPRRIGPDEAVVGIDLQLEQMAPIPSLPWVNSLRISVEGGEPETLNPDTEAAYRDDSPLLSPLFDDGDKSAVLVGLVSTPRSAEWFVYSTEACAEALAEAIGGQFSQLSVEGSARRDPEWSVYSEFLRPSSLERRLIDTRRQLEELRKLGRRVDEPRVVAHTMWFSSADDRNTFAEQICEEGFILHYPQEELLVDAQNGDEVAFGLTISREEAVDVDAMDELVSDLFKHVTGLGGEYEAWHL